MQKMQISPHKLKPQQGFSLLELLIVMTLLALAASVVPVTVFKSADQTLVKTTARTLVTALRATRADAMATQRPVPFTLDLENQSYALGRDVARNLPDSVALTATVPDAFLQDSRASVVFFPDGSSAGGQITVRAGPYRQNIDVRWLTGRVSLVD